MMACVKKKMPFLLSVQHDVLSGLGRLFYVISPAETSFEKVEDVPDFVNKVFTINNYNRLTTTQTIRFTGLM